MEFTEVGPPVCDGISLPECKHLFGCSYLADMRKLFINFGIPIHSVTPSAIKGCVFIKLEESRNEFT